ncbi:FAD synthase [Mycoplasma hafezii]|uniref:FAD synthase n=1 Tax=Mycoplasma hafezii TaxID=525886 RepID=UPI003CF17F66
MTHFVEPKVEIDEDSILVIPFESFTPQENDAFIIGSFESFHKGHFLLYQEMLQKEKGRKILVTFSNEDLMPKFKKQVFTDNNAKYLTMAQLEIDAIVELVFSKVALLSGEEFLQKLTNNLKCQIIVGADFKFGRNASCDASDIQRILPNAEVHAYKPYLDNNQKVSTSKLKEELYVGNVQYVNELLPVSEYAFSAYYKKDEPLQTFKYLTAMHPGIYLAITQIDNMCFYVLLHVNMQQERFIHPIDLDNLNIKDNQMILVTVLNKVRLIISKQKDNVMELDYLSAKEQFNK